MSGNDSIDWILLRMVRAIDGVDGHEGMVFATRWTTSLHNGLSNFRVGLHKKVGSIRDKHGALVLAFATLAAFTTSSINKRPRHLAVALAGVQSVPTRMAIPTAASISVSKSRGHKSWQQVQRPREPRADADRAEIATIRGQNSVDPPPFSDGSYCSTLFRYPENWLHHTRFDRTIEIKPFTPCQGERETEQHTDLRPICERTGIGGFCGKRVDKSPNNCLPRRKSLFSASRKRMAGPYVLGVTRHIISPSRNVPASRFVRKKAESPGGKQNRPGTSRIGL